MQRARAAILTAASTLVAAACVVEPAPAVTARGIDVALPDAAPDAISGRAPAPPPRSAARPRPMMQGPDGELRPLPDPADPHGAQRRFHLAWLRISLPTRTPSGIRMVRTTYVPETLPGRGFWRVLREEPERPRPDD